MTPNADGLLFVEAAVGWTVTEDPPFDARVRAGVAMYNSGFRHAAHDAWEDAWLDLESGSDDERFLHGLIQFTAVAVHAQNRNWVGLQGLCASAREYLAELPEHYRQVDVARVREALSRIAADPGVIERRGFPALRYDGGVLSLPDLDIDAALVAAPLVAEETDLDEEIVRAGVEYAWQDIADGDETSRFVTLAADVAREDSQRPVVTQRLADHVRRRQQRESDVEGLFD